MRITESMVPTRVLDDLRRAQNEINRSSAQISSGQRLLDASIDPEATYRALRLRQELTNAESMRSTIGLAKGWMETTEEGVASVNDLVHRVRELVVQAGNGTLSAPDRVAIADEVSSIIESTKQAMNRRFGDDYVFSGQATTTVPYTPTGPDAYAGDSAGIVRTIGPNVSMQINVTGLSIIGDGTDGRLLNTLRDIHTHLTSGLTADVNALRTTDLTNLQNNLQTILSARSQIGAGLNRLEHADGRLANQILDSSALLEDTEATDLTSTIVALKSQQASYQAALNMGSQIIGPSLLDFLR